ncbi:type I methionyl aminopeptidase [Phnomibacter ginsenosidimutans]|uniref:type I methionyl aminopeptidase n=1 Tax=Phnomibacter ginsenosidimutans TaxID=2676868 RepID=UPI001FEA9A71|nr:type I methionyl aminopeptidase [Phnomibacter ginsenosidimutans]
MSLFKKYKEVIYLKNKEEIELMRHSNLLVGETIATLAAMLRPGITTSQLDLTAGQFIRDNGGVPSFLNYNGYPYNTCISVNDAVVHGFPDNRELKPGDIISIDCGVFKNGFHGDSAYTFAIKDADADALAMMRVTKESLYKGIEKARAGNRIGDVAFAVQDYAERQHPYGVVRELVGHGIGRKMHEDPQVPNYGKRGTGAKLQAGMTIAIEPMVNLGKKEVYTDEDGWTIRTKDGKVAAHYEHSVAVQKDKADILSSFASIEAAEKANTHLESAYY